MEYSIKPWYKQWWGVIAIIFLAIILFFMAAGVFYSIGITKNAAPKISQTDQQPSGQKLDSSNASAKTQNVFYSDNNYWLGSSSAKIVIVEFGDFSCPVCEKAFPTVRELSLNYKNDIKFVWRDYPVVSEYSANLAIAGRCAGEQGLFWFMHDKLFQNQGVGQTDDLLKQTDQLTALANQIGADAAKFKDCLKKQKYLPQIQKDLSDGENFGITGTPTYFINGQKIEGNMPYEMFVKIIEELKIIQL